MENKKSLKVTTGVFIFFLTMTAINKVDSLYIPLKQSIAYQKIPEIWIYSTELLAFVILGITILRIISHINKQKFFIQQNFRLFYTAAIALFLPPVVHFLGKIFDKAHNWEAFKMDETLWFTASLFLLIIAEIFRYGTKLKEEQDLTI